MVFHESGYIVTTAQVVSGATRVTVRTASGAIFAGRILASDNGLDLAKVKVETSDLPIVVFAEFGRLQVGDAVFALGYALAGEREDSVAVTRGIVSAFRTETENGRQFVETDAALDLGQVGGPLVNDCGQLIGIGTSRISDAIDRPS